MAGSRQHYLPRFLLRGFASRQAKRGTFTWYYRMGHSAKEVSIRDVGLGTDFYGQPAPSSLDDLLTTREGEWAAVLNKVRRTRTIEAEQLPALVSFVATMAIRTKHFRTIMARAADLMLREMKEQLITRDFFEEITKDLIANGAPELRQAVREALLEGLGSSTPELEALALSLLQQHQDALISTVAETGLPIADQALTDLALTTPTLAATSHNKGLASSLTSKEFSERELNYTSRSWSLMPAQAGAFILGDVGVIHYDPASGRAYAAAFNEIEGGLILLPIVDDLLLVGGSAGIETPPTPQELNRQTARLSVAFFTSSTRTDQELGLIPEIGASAEIINAEGMREMVKEARERDRLERLQ